MLQYPTNVSLQNKTIDFASSLSYSATFNGDVFVLYAIKIFDLTLGTTSYIRMPSYINNAFHVFHNKDMFLYLLGDNLVYGHNYSFQLMLSQATINSNKYDIYATSGKIQSSSNSLFIESGITAFYEWSTSNGMAEPVIIEKQTPQGEVIGEVAFSGAEIEILGERHLITAYNTETGEIETDSPFSAVVTSGTPYRIYKNYLITPQYFFSVMNTPVVTVVSQYRSMNTENKLFYEIQGSYSQTQGDLIHKYCINLYSQMYDDSTGYSRTLVASSGDIYSQEIYFVFDIFEHFEDYFQRPTSYVAEIVVETHSGMKVIAENIADDAVDSTYNPNNILFSLEVHSNPNTEQGNTVAGGKQYVAITWKYEDEESRISYVEIYRRINSSQDWEFLGYQKPSRFESLFIDYTIPTICNATYKIIPRLDSAGLKFCELGVVEKQINVDMIGWSISGLSLSPASLISDLEYRVGDQWQFVGEISDTTKTQNLGREIHSNYARYPVVANSNSNYISGSFTALIDQPRCGNYNDNNLVVKRWREFVAKYDLFLLKTSKGEVFVVAITNTEISCEEMEATHPCKVTFDWLEVKNLKDIFIS